MDDRPEMIRQQMDQTRAGLTDKLESLESRVSEGIETTGTAVSDTYNTITSTLQTVSDALNLPLQVKRYPWLAIGGGVAAGFIAARFIGSSSRTPNVERTAVAHSEPPQQVAEPLTGNRVLMEMIRDLATQVLPRALDFVFAPPAPSNSTAPTGSDLPGASRQPLADRGARLLPHSMQSRPSFERPTARRGF